MGRILGVDVGSVRIGLALSDETRLIARPFATIRRRGDRAAAAAIARVAGEHDVERIVVGLPLSLAGGEQETSSDARRFAVRLEEAAALPVTVWDERLTTSQAERALLESDMRRSKRKDVIDQVAAAILLQSFLDHERMRLGDGEGGAGEPAS